LEDGQSEKLRCAIEDVNGLPARRVDWAGKATLVRVKMAELYVELRTLDEAFGLAVEATEKLLKAERERGADAELLKEERAAETSNGVLRTRALLARAEAPATMMTVTSDEIREA